MKWLFVFIFLHTLCLGAETSPDRVRNFYLLNHTSQTVEFVLGKKAEYLPPKHLKMSLWDAMKLIDTLDNERGSCAYYQTAEALKREGHPRWLILVGLIHDLGKVLAFFGEPQWAIEGHTFPVGCAFSSRIIFSNFFQFNPDRHVQRYQTPTGVYLPNCGFDKVNMSWGQNEYLFHVVKTYLPPEASYILRYHAFYAAHREGAYEYLMSDYDVAMRPWLELFCRYKDGQVPEKCLDLVKLQPYYEKLVAEFFPALLDW